MLSHHHGSRKCLAASSLARQDDENDSIMRHENALASTDRSSCFLTSSSIASSIRYLPGTLGSTPSPRSLSAVAGPMAPTRADLIRRTSCDVGILLSAMLKRLDAEAALVNRTAWNCLFSSPARKSSTLSLFIGINDW